MSGNKIPLAGVIGHPIAHSKSPNLHGHWLKRYGLSGHYVPIDIDPDKLSELEGRAGWYVYFLHTDEHDQYLVRMIPQ